MLAGERNESVDGDRDARDARVRRLEGEQVRRERSGGREYQGGEAQWNLGGWEVI